ncbi:MAG TPA: LegC family aminotransferase [Candidatus Latescibacteria bacterium]|nr:LegC family aminotransferase [Candidatus Latescibacterota bacterium]
MIPLSVPTLGGREWEYIKECLDTNWVSSVGPFVDRFEQDVAARVDAGFAVAAVSGTAALHIALLVAGVREEDEVVIPNLTFVATANAVRYCGAHPVLVDLEPDHWQIDTGLVRRFLESDCESVDGELRNRRTGRRVGALMPVHLLGHPCNMDALSELAGTYGLPLVEDASESLGATFDGRPMGTIGDIGCFSFNGNKVITAGGGGMIVTDDEAWAKRAKHLTTQAKCDPIEYDHDEVGYNYRMVNVLAALGCAQLEQLDRFLETKRSIAARYDQAFSSVQGITSQKEAAWASSISWLYTVRIDAERCDRRRLITELGDRGIQARPLWKPMHGLPMFRDALRIGTGVSDDLYACCVSLPCSTSLTHGDQDRVIEALLDIVFKDQPGRP